MSIPDPRLLWRCRRGLKELDLLLERFAKERSASESPALRRAFERLLELPDPLLAELLLGPPESAPSFPGDPELEQVAALVASAGRR
ncbi:MAG: succinate dehydrogenase assembly factor 2 [Steroidobacteraceae bacterium]